MRSVAWCRQAPVTQPDRAPGHGCDDGVSAQAIDFSVVSRRMDRMGGSKNDLEGRLSTPGRSGADFSDPVPSAPSEQTPRPSFALETARNARFEAHRMLADAHRPRKAALRTMDPAGKQGIRSCALERLLARIVSQAIVLYGVMIRKRENERFLRVGCEGAFRLGCRCVSARCRCGTKRPTGRRFGDPCAWRPPKPDCFTGHSPDGAVRDVSVPRCNASRVLMGGAGRGCWQGGPMAGPS
jgi:hypothetical protein